MAKRSQIIGIVKTTIRRYGDSEMLISKRSPNCLVIVKQKVLKKIIDKNVVEFDR